MSALQGLEPARVFHYFEEICNIPHGSGNVEQISNYLKRFADEHGLYCIQDEMNNIIIIKEASADYEKEEPFILQGHMDMVTVAKPGYFIDFSKDPLKVCHDGEYVFAEGTSLGGDDGIAVAYALAILEAENISHPKLEVIITTDEEVGMDGAIGIDLSMLEGKRMLNLDQEEEGILLTSCAGGGRVDVSIPLAKCATTDENAKWAVFEVMTKGFTGGHSGIEISKGSGNANYLLIRLMYDICQKVEVELITAKGGLADNAIPREAMMRVRIAANRRDEFVALFEKNRTEILREFETTDREADITLTECDLSDRDAGEDIYTRESTRRAFACVLGLPNGIQTMSADVKDLVETSLNLGVMMTENGALNVGYAVRSSVDSAKYALVNRMRAVAELAGATATLRSVYPGWAYNKDSALREKVIRIYKEMYRKEPVVTAVHAGLECGILSEKIQGLDCISLGPDMQNVHTTEEKISIASVERTWQFILAILADK